MPNEPSAYARKLVRGGDIGDLWTLLLVSAAINFATIPDLLMISEDHVFLTKILPITVVPVLLTVWSIRFYREGAALRAGKPSATPALFYPLLFAAMLSASYCAVLLANGYLSADETIEVSGQVEKIVPARSFLSKRLGYPRWCVTSTSVHRDFCFTMAWHRPEDFPVGSVMTEHFHRGWFDILFVWRNGVGWGWRGSISCF